MIDWLKGKVAILWLECSRGAHLPHHFTMMVGWLIGRSVFNSTFSTNSLYHAMSAQDSNPITYLLYTDVWTRIHTPVLALSNQVLYHSASLWCGLFTMMKLLLLLFRIAVSCGECICQRQSSTWRRLIMPEKLRSVLLQLPVQLNTVPFLL